MIRLLMSSLWLCVALTLPAAHAAPGAHGPNGEHLDAPGATASGATTRPVIEANTESFELVGTLQDSEFSVLVDRYVTNEPVTTGTLEVELGALKAQGKLNADIGSFSFTEPKLLAALRQPGHHALVFTLLTGNDTDLIEGKLHVAQGGGAHGHWYASPVVKIGAVVLVVLFVMVMAWRLRRRRTVR